jgi:hypothetical protein
MRNFTKILLTAFVLSFAFQTPVLFFHVAASTSSTNYPLALHFSIKLDAATNEWSVNVANVGSKTLFVIFSISPTPILPAWTAENHTTLSPRTNTAVLMRCYDPFQKMPCTLKNNKIYSLVYDAWTSDSSYSFSLSAGVSATNHMFVFNTFPFMALKFTTSIHPSLWNVTVTNVGTSTGKFQAFLGYFGPNNPNWYQVGTPVHTLKSGEGFQVMNKAYSPRTNAGSAATIDVHAFYSGMNGVFGWSATLDVEETLTVK